MSSRSRHLRTGLRTTLRGAFALTLGAAALLTTSCTAIVPLEPGKDAANPTCADLIVRLPSIVASLPERETNAQATGAWGTPASVLLRCGVTVPAPTTLPCLNVNGIDWIEDDSRAPLYLYTTYGRDPATELVIASDKVSGSTVLVDLAKAVSAIPATRQCVGVADLTIPTDGGTPVPAP